MCTSVSKLTYSMRDISSSWLLDIVWKASESCVLSYPLSYCVSFFSFCLFAPVYFQLVSLNHISSLEFDWTPSGSLILSFWIFVSLSFCLVLLSLCHCVFLSSMQRGPLRHPWWWLSNVGWLLSQVYLEQKCVGQYWKKNNYQRHPNHKSLQQDGMEELMKLRKRTLAKKI